MKRSTCMLCLSALGVVLTFVASIIRIPIPSVRLYFHLGEVVIFVMALLFGRVAGGLAGAIGSSLADIQLGFLVWAPLSLVIKGLEGYVVGWMSEKQDGTNDIPALITGSAIMIGGYAAATILLFGWPALILEVPVDIVQCSVAIAITLFLVRNVRERFPNIPKLKGRAEWKK